MRRVAWRFVLRLARVLSLVLLAALGAAVLTRFSPGYFTDTREMDAFHAEGARNAVAVLEADQGSLPTLFGTQLHSWMHGDLGRSRHYDVPVSSLLRERAGVSANLLARGVLEGWLTALVLALPLSARRSSRGELLISGATAALLSVPVGVLATLALLSNTGGPVLILAALIAVRDFKLLYRLLDTAWRAPHLLHARAGGISGVRAARVHLFPVFCREISALAMMSLVVALSALVPVEVIFDLPGLGQLAWSAAMNRDLPVLVAVTALLAACVGVAGLFTATEVRAESDIVSSSKPNAAQKTALGTALPTSLSDDTSLEAATCA